MNSNLSKVSLVILLGGCLAVGLLGLFLWTNPALASMIETDTATEPTQELIWAPVEIRKPTITPVQPSVSNPQIQQSASSQLDTPNGAATDTPAILVMEIVDGDSAIMDNSAQGTGVASDGRWIEVDLSEQRTFVYEGDVLVNSFIVSTGMPGTPTVTGEYVIYVKVPMQDMSGPGYYLADVPWVMYFFDEYGFHGTYWHNNFGTPMSRGCVNLTIDDAKWLYDWASVGTKVNVHE
jgi:lipoprotein-anchoring transpeptidase ErfK/SrfK